MQTSPDPTLSVLITEKTVNVAVRYGDHVYTNPDLAFTIEEETLFDKCMQRKKGEGMPWLSACYLSSVYTFLHSFSLLTCNADVTVPLLVYQCIAECLGNT